MRVMVVDDHPMWRDGVARDLTEAALDRRPRPTAFFVLSSAMVEGVLDAFRRRGVVCPDDVALIVWNTRESAGQGESVWHVRGTAVP